MQHIKKEAHKMDFLIMPVAGLEPFSTIIRKTSKIQKILYLRYFRLLIILLKIQYSVQKPAF